MDKLEFKLNEKGLYVKVHREFPVYNKKGRLIYQADLACERQSHNGLIELDAFEVKTGCYRKAQQKGRHQRAAWFRGINSVAHPEYFSRNFIFYHSKDGVQRWKA